MTPPGETAAPKCWPIPRVYGAKGKHFPLSAGRLRNVQAGDGAGDDETLDLRGAFEDRVGL
jgi:hypothetical protein